MIINADIVQTSDKKSHIRFVKSNNALIFDRIRVNDFTYEVRKPAYLAMFSECYNEESRTKILQEIQYCITNNTDVTIDAYRSIRTKSQVDVVIVRLLTYEFLFTVIHIDGQKQKDLLLEKICIIDDDEDMNTFVVMDDAESNVFSAHVWINRYSVSVYEFMKSSLTTNSYNMAVDFDKLFGDNETIYSIEEYLSDTCNHHTTLTAHTGHKNMLINLVIRTMITPDLDAEKLVERKNYAAELRILDSAFVDVKLLEIKE